MINIFGQCPNMEGFSITCNKCNAETYQVKTSKVLNKEIANFGYESFSKSNTNIDLCSECVKKTSALEMVELFKVQRKKDLDSVRKYMKEIYEKNG